MGAAGGCAAGRGIGSLAGKAVSYTVFVLWTLITVVPLVWMLYSSFKSNEELTLDIYALPRALFDNRGDEYVVINRELNVILDYDPEVDTRERLFIESTTIAPGRRLMVFALVKDELPPRIAALEPGDRLTVSELPKRVQAKIDRQTAWFNFRSAIIRGKLAGKFANSVIYASVSTFFIVILPTLFRFGSPLPLAMPASRLMSTATGGVLVMNV